MKVSTLARQFATKYDIPADELALLLETTQQNLLAANRRLKDVLSIVYEYFSGISDPLADPNEVIAKAAERQRVYLDESVVDVVRFHLEACEN